MIVNHSSTHVQILHSLPTIPISCRVRESLWHTPVKMVGCRRVKAIGLSISHLKRIGYQCHLREIGIAVALPSIALPAASFKAAQKGVICSACASLCSNVAYHSLTVWTEHVPTFLGVTSSLPVVSSLFIRSCRASLRRVPWWHIVVGCCVCWTMTTERSVIIVPHLMCSLISNWTTVGRTIVAIMAIAEVSPLLLLLLLCLFTVLVLVILEHLVCVDCVDCVSVCRF